MITILAHDSKQHLAHVSFQKQSEDYQRTDAYRLQFMEQLALMGPGAMLPTAITLVVFVVLLLVGLCCKQAASSHEQTLKTKTHFLIGSFVANTWTGVPVLGSFLIGYVVAGVDWYDRSLFHPALVVFVALVFMQTHFHLHGILRRFVPFNFRTSMLFR